MNKHNFRSLKNSTAGIAIAILVSALLCVVSCALADEPEPTVLPEKLLSPFLENYCVDCHSGDDPNGQVSFESPVWTVSNNSQAQRWQDVLDVLNAGDMPPEDSDQPEADELQAVLRTLTKSLQKARRRLTEHGGEIAMRRLNRREYVATIRELFDFEIFPKDLPTDAESDSFDTVGDDQFFTSAHFDQYFDLAKTIVKNGFVWSAKPQSETITNRSDPEDSITKQMRKRLAEHDKKIAMIAEGKSWKEVGFNDAGQMKLFVFRSKKKQNPKRYLELPRVDEGQYLAPDNQTKRAKIFAKADPRAEYRLRIHAGVRPDQSPLRHYVSIENDEELTTLEILGTETEPQTVETVI